MRVQNLALTHTSNTEAANSRLPEACSSFISCTTARRSLLSRLRSTLGASGVTCPRQRACRMRLTAGFRRLKRWDAMRAVGVVRGTLDPLSLHPLSARAQAHCQAPGGCHRCIKGRLEISNGRMRTDVEPELHAVGKLRVASPRAWRVWRNLPS